MSLAESSNPNAGRPVLSIGRKPLKLEAYKAKIKLASAFRKAVHEVAGPDGWFQASKNWKPRLFGRFGYSFSRWMLDSAICEYWGACKWGSFDNIFSILPGLACLPFLDQLI